MPQVLLEKAFHCSDKKSLVQLEYVCKRWHIILRNDNITFWKTRCLTLNPQGKEEEAEGKTKAELNLNLDGATIMRTDFKAFARPLSGNLFVIPNQPIQLYITSNSGRKLCVATKVISAASQKEARLREKEARLHPSRPNSCPRDICPDDIKGSWQDNYSGIRNFPIALPLRLFIKPDGSIINTGEKLRLYFDKKFVVLTCCFQALPLSKDEYKIKALNFQEEISKRIPLCISPVYMYAKSADVAIEQANPNQNNWTNLHALI